MRNTSTHFHSAEDALVISLILTFTQRKKVFYKIKTHLKLYQNATPTLTFYILIISCQNKVVM